MKRVMLFGLPGLIFMVFAPAQAGAQSRPGTVPVIERAVQDYQDFSALGRAGSAYMDENTIDSFRDLFEPDANLFWDLFITGSGRVSYLLTLDEYIDSVRRNFTGKKPVLSYGSHRIVVNSNGSAAIAYLHKTLNLPGRNEPVTHRLTRNSLNLRILFNIRNDTALIQNITEDSRLTRIRDISMEGGYIFINKIFSGFMEGPSSSVYREPAGGLSFGRQSGFHLGLNIDFRLDRKKADGILLSTGLTWSVSRLSVNAGDHAEADRQSFDPGKHAFEATVYDRARAISEDLSFTAISVPVTVKWFMTRRLYLRAGPQFSMASGRSETRYSLSHTGGGKITLDNGQQWFYLDEQHEIDDSRYGFFRNRAFSFSRTVQVPAFQVSAIVAIGFEARIKKMTVGVEPWLSLGLTALTKSRPGSGIRFYPEGEYTGVPETLETPRLCTFGINLVVGKMFYR